MIVTDTLTLDASGLTLTRDGYLVGDAKVSRAGNVQQYLGRELGLAGDEATKVFGVYRDPEVVFADASMLSLAGRPVTRGHPDEIVTAKNWKDLAKGQVGGVIRRDGEHVVAPMAIMDHMAVEEVRAGARSLSAGYTVSVIRDEGVSPGGEPYQFRQAGDLRFNHVAYLPNNNPRAGNTRLGDHQPEGAQPVATKTITFDGLPVDVTDAAEAVINKLKGMLDTAGKALETAKAEHATAIAAKDAELGAKDAKIAEVEKQVITGAALDALVADRAAVVAKAKAIAPTLDAAGKTNADVKRAAVAAKLGDEKVKDKSDDYVGALFDHLAADAEQEPDPIRDAVKDGLVNDADAAEKAVKDARAEMLAELRGEKAAA
jgi:hypothetical protein